MNRSFLSFLFLWMGASPPLSRAAAPNEQAEAFFARGLAAEQRGDFIVADHCFELTLRANPGHAQAQTKLEELEARHGSWTEEKARKVVLNHFKVDIFRESNLRMTWDEITSESGIPVIFENDGQDVGRINLDLKNVTVAEVLEKIAEQTRFDLTYERRAIRFSPKTIDLTDEVAKANSGRMVRFDGVVKRIDGNNGNHIWIRFGGAETYLFSGAERYSQVFGPSDREFPIKPGQRLRARGRIILDKGIPYIRLTSASQWEIIASSGEPAPDTPATAKSDPETDFKGWLKTVQFKHGHGDGVIWSVDEGVVLHYSQKDLEPAVRRFEILSIDPETRTVTWKQPSSENSIRIASDFKKFEWKRGDDPFVPQPLAIEPRDLKIFGSSPVP